MMRSIGAVTMQVMLLWITAPLGYQGPAAPTDLFQQPVPQLELNDETILDGVAKMTQVVHIAVAVEFPLAKTISLPEPAPNRFQTTIRAGTVTEILDRLCSIDPTFVWARLGNVAHLYPRNLANDESYLLNRQIPVLTFQQTPDAQKAVFQAVRQLPPPKEQIAMLELGPDVRFATPFTATFHDITVREAFDKIAQRFGPGYGWQLAGAEDFRIITLHAGLSVSRQGKKPN